jgi:hypothetical protein
VSPFFEEVVKCQLNKRSERSPTGPCSKRDFYLAYFLRCTGYELVNLRDEGRRKVFVFRDRATRRADVMAFFGDATSVPPLAFAATIKDMKGLLHNG